MYEPWSSSSFNSSEGTSSGTVVFLNLALFNIFVTNVLLFVHKYNLYNLLKRGDGSTPIFDYKIKKIN